MSATDTASKQNTIDAASTPDNKTSVLKSLDELLGNRPIDEAQVKQLRKAIDGLGELDADIEPDKSIIKKSESLRQRVHQQVEKRDKDYNTALTLTKTLEKTIKANQLAEAEALEKQIRQLVETIPGLSAQRLATLNKKLQRVRPQIRKLESWRHWGTTQAREDLIEQVRLLIGSRLSPEKIAKTIKQARAQWQEWDKAGDNAGKSLWETFDKTCEKAYQPCIAHFDKLKKQRAANLEKARAHLDKLQAWFEEIDWKNPDWKAIDKRLRRERGAFFKIGQADFKHRKKLRTRLDQIHDQFETHLGRERKRCLKTREKIIADTQALADSINEGDDIRPVLDQLDKLREQWVPTVLEKRGVENALWEKFQAASQQIYDHRDANRKAQFAERDEHLKQKNALVEELSSLAGESADTLLENPSKLAQLKDQWAEIGDVPRKAEKSLMNRWREAQKAFAGALKAAQSQAANAEFSKLIERARLCDELEAGGNAEKLTKKWDALPPLAKAELQTAIDTRWQASAAPPDKKAQENNLRLKNEACLKLEVMLDLPSPEAFSGERMKFQIERLNASMRKDANAQETPEQLWSILLTTGAVPTADADALGNRLDALVAHKMKN